jgi:hypothetical protein
VTSSFYKFGGFVDVAEHEFAACDTAIHVVGGSGKIQTTLLTAHKTQIKIIK